MLSQNNAEGILSRFPGPVTLRPSLKKWSVLLVCYAAVVALGLAGVALGVDAGWLGAFGIQGHWIGWFLAALFSAFMLMAVIAPSLRRLTLDREGFEVTGPFGCGSVAWQDANHFKAAEIYLWVEVVAFDRANATKECASSVRRGQLGETFGLAASDLATLMNLWRERAISSQ